MMDTYRKTYWLGRMSARLRFLGDKETVKEFEKEWDKTTKLQEKAQ